MLPITVQPGAIYRVENGFQSLVEPFGRNNLRLGGYVEVAGWSLALAPRWPCSVSRCS
jgi:hypothetical protein